MPVVVGGPASVEMVDREGHLITTDALTKAFDKYMDNFRTRNVMVMHSDVQVGHALPAYITKGGSVFRSGVDPRGLFFITELRNDTRIAAKVKEQIESGKMRSYSIAGNATESKDIHKEDGTKIMQVNNLELAEVTICEKGVNQGAHFDLMKGMLLDKQESSRPAVRSNDLLLEDTLSKGIFDAFKKKPSVEDHLRDPNFREKIKAETADLQAKQKQDSAQRERVTDLLRTHLSTPPEPRSQGVKDAMRDIQARRAQLSNQPKPQVGTDTQPTPPTNLDASLEKGVGKLVAAVAGNIVEDKVKDKVSEHFEKGVGDLLGISQRAKDTKALKNFRAGFKDGGEFHQGNTKLNMVTEHATGGASKGIDHSKLHRTAMRTYENHRQPQVEEDGSVTPPKSVKQAIDATTNTMGHAMQAVHSNLIDEHAGEGAGAAAHNKFFPGIAPERPSASINKSTPMLGMFQEFMAKEKKHSTDTPLGRQTVHPDQEGEEKRRKQLECIQREFGLPEKTHSAEYNRYAPVDYKNPFSFTSARVVNQSGQDLAHPQIKDEYLLHGTDKENESRVGKIKKSNMQNIDKVLSKLFQKAGKDKEDRTPANSPTPNEFPADTSTSPYQSKGLFEKQHSGEAAQNYGGRGNPAQQRAAARARGQEADIPPEDPEFEYESSYGPHDDRIDPDLQEDYKRADEARIRGEHGESARLIEETKDNPEARQYFGTKWGSRGQAPLITPKREQFDRSRPVIGRRGDPPTSTRTGTTSRGFRQEGGAGRKASFRGIEGGRRPRPTRYKDVGRETGRAFDDSVETPKQETDYAPPALRNSMQKQVRPMQGTDVAKPKPKPQQGTGVRTGGMPQQQGKQGPTTAWGDPKRAAVPTMRQQMPWDEKSLEKDEQAVRNGMSSYLKKKAPSLGPSRGPEPHDEAGAAASRKRVAAGQGKPSPTPFKRPRDIATQAMDREAKTRERGDPGFPKQASLLKTTASPDSDGKKVPYLHGWGTDDTTKRHIESLRARDQREDSERRAGGGPSEKESQQRRFRSAQSFMAGTSPSEAKRLSNIKPDALEDPGPPRLTNSLEKEHKSKKGKAILAVPYNLATQRIMGKDAPASVSADDRLKQAVLILLKQQQTAEEVGRDVIGSGAIGIKTKDAPAGQGAMEGAAAGKGGGLVGRKTYGAAKGAVGLAGSAAKKLGAAGKGVGGAVSSYVSPPATVDVQGVTGGRAPVKGPPSPQTDPNQRVGSKPETTPVTPKKTPVSTDPGSQRIGGPDFSSGT